MTYYSTLLDKGRLKRGRFARRQVDDCLSIARRDVHTARALIGTSPEWSFNIAYNAMHQAGRAFMFQAGYRAAGEGRHATLVRFLEIALGGELEAMLSLLDRMRRKRNRATYEIVGTISRKEAEEATQVAEEFVVEITARIGRSRK